MKYELTKELKDYMVNFFSSIVVKATIGYEIMRIVDTLNKLPEIKNKEELPKELKK